MTNRIDNTAPVPNLPSQSTSVDLKGKFNRYVEKYCPKGVDDEQLTRKLVKGMAFLENLQNPNLRDQTFGELTAQYKTLEEKKKDVADIITAADFMAKNKAGLLDVDSEDSVLDSGAYLFKDPGGVIGKLLDECGAYVRQSTHFDAYREDPSEKVKEKKGVDFPSGLLPTVRQDGKIKGDRKHVHYYSFRKGGEDYIGIKLKAHGWHGVSGFFKKEQIGHSTGHVKEFVKTRPPIKKLMAKVSNFLETLNIKRPAKQRVITRRDSDKKYHSITKDMLKSQGITIKKPGKLKKAVRPSSEVKVKIKGQQIKDENLKGSLLNFVNRGSLGDIITIWDQVDKTRLEGKKYKEYEKAKEEFFKKTRIERFYDDSIRMGDEMAFNLEQPNYHEVYQELKKRLNR